MTGTLLCQRLLEVGRFGRFGGRPGTGCDGRRRRGAAEDAHGLPLGVAPAAGSFEEDAGGRLQRSWVMAVR